MAPVDRKHMIRRILTMTIFTATVLLAAFGQDVFGRNHLISLADRARTDAPRHIEMAWNKTDKALAQLVTEAGTEPTSSICSYDSLDWAIKSYKS
jgi:hypothetical protein